jgi:hypothetical protein
MYVHAAQLLDVVYMGVLSIVLCRLVVRLQAAIKVHKMEKCIHVVRTLYIGD